MSQCVAKKFNLWRLITAAPGFCLSSSAVSVPIDTQLFVSFKGSSVAQGDCATLGNLL